MTVYVLELAVILIAGSVFKPSKSLSSRRSFVIAICIVLLAVSGLRSCYVGSDTLQFWNAYQRSSFEGSRYEIGFIALIRLLNVFSHDPQLLLFATSAIMTFCVGYTIYRLDCNPVLAFYLYISLLTYATNMNLMRQALAASVVVLAIPWLIEGKRLRFVVAVLLGSLFHITALIMLALVPLSFLLVTKKVVLGYCVLAAALSLAPDAIWGFVETHFDQYASYSSSRWAGSNALAAPIMTVMDVLLIAIANLAGGKGSQFGDSDVQESVLLHGAMLQVVFQLLACFVNIFQRFTTFTSLLLSLYVAYRFAEVDTRGRFFFTYLIYVLTALFFVVIMLYRPQWHGVVPFSFFWV